MRLHRFIGQFDLGEKMVSITDSSLRHQISRVFRMNVGDELLLCDGNNQEARVRIEELSLSNVLVSIQEVYTVPVFTDRAVTLFFSIIKSDHVDLIVEKTTELGVNVLVPIISERTIKKNVRLDRLQTIAREASEQCGLGTLPMIEEPLLFKDALGRVNMFDKAFFCDFDGVPLKKVSKTAGMSVALFVGPEGGWSLDERKLADEAGCVVVSLGSLVLRAETAAMVGVYELVS